MYLYAVVQQPNPPQMREIVWRIVGRAERETTGSGTVAISRQDEVAMSDNFENLLSQERMVFWTYTEEEANRLAKDLAGKHPGRSYLVMTASAIYSAQVTDVVKRVHTPGKGVLPA
jgi:hypothetical protein